MDQSFVITAYLFIYILHFMSCIVFEQSYLTQHPGGIRLKFLGPMTNNDLCMSSRLNLRNEQWIRLQQQYKKSIIH